MDLDAIRAAFGADPAPQDWGAIAAGVEADIAEMDARRRRRYERHSASRARAVEAYERAKRQRDAELGEQPRTAIAASFWWDEPPEVRIW